MAVPNERGGRPCDLQVASVYGRFDAGPYLCNRGYLGRFGGLRGEAITQQLAFFGFCHDPDIPKRVSVRQVVEVFPHPASVSLFDLDCSLKDKARKGPDYSQRRVELIRLRDLLVSLDTAEPPLHLPEEVASLEIEERRGGRLKEAEDLLDSIVCA